MISDLEWQPFHKEVMVDFLNYLNHYTDQFVLKGGTALMLCYGLDRFSEDIDLDCVKQDIKEHVRRFCEKHHFEFKIPKDTQTVKRCLIDYGNADHKLKVEVSYRNQAINTARVDIIANIRVYSIDQLVKLKSFAYMGRDKIRDLYDLCFIAKRYYDVISDESKSTISDVFSQKGIDQVEYLTNTQTDPLINNEQLQYDFLEVYEKLGFEKPEIELAAPKL